MVGTWNVKPLAAGARQLMWVHPPLENFYVTATLLSQPHDFWIMTRILAWERFVAAMYIGYHLDRRYKWYFLFCVHHGGTPTDHLGVVCEKSTCQAGKLKYIPGRMIP